MNLEVGLSASREELDPSSLFFLFTLDFRAGPLSDIGEQERESGSTEASKNGRLPIHDRANGRDRSPSRFSQAHSHGLGNRTQRPQSLSYIVRGARWISSGARGLPAAFQTHCHRL